MRALRAAPAALTSRAWGGGRVAGRILAGLALTAPALTAFACREARPPGKSYALTGVVASVNRAVREVVVAHDDIPGFMPAMTMPFPLHDEALLSTLKAGDTLSATLVVRDTSYRLEDVKVTGRAAPGAVPAPSLAAGKAAAEPDALAPVPDVVLTNQDGRRVRLSDYRGQAVAVTFIFTRCPLPDFCPRMGEHFAAAARVIATDEALRGRTRLLAVSFDPEFDTPEVLRAWGRLFVKNGGFDHFELLTGESAEVRRLADFLTVEYEKDASGFTHNLRTAVVDPDGRLFRLHRGNDWTPAELVRDLREAVTPPRPAP